MEKNYDFAVVGAGVTGAWTAFELSKYNATICLLEADNDVCSGSSKANSAIVHAGYDAKSETLMAKLNVRGNELIRSLYKTMAIPFRQIGSLVLAFDDEGLDTIKKLYDRGIENGVSDMRLLGAEETLTLEPNLSTEVKGSLLAKTAGVISAFELCASAAEVAVNNGADFYRNFKVVGIEKNGDTNTLKDNTGRTVKAKYVINAAGVHADEIAGLMGDDTFTVTPRRGEYAILDNSVGQLVSHIIFQPPVRFGKGILASPTVDGNILVGPTADNIEDKEDKSTTDEGLRTAFAGAKRSVPSISERDTITLFSGIRPIGDKGDFIIGFSEKNGRLINAAGIESPGLTAAPATGEYIVSLIKEKGIKLEKKAAFKPGREVVRFKELSDEEKNALIKKNPLYGRIICRCETVTEGEIVDAVRRNVGACDLDGVKRRVRAGMGRCQGGFCSPRVMEILSKELDLPVTEITKFGGGSWLVDRETK